MRIIAIEEHMFPRELVAAAGLDLGPRADLRADELDDCGAARLRMMDEAGVDMQILSLALGNTIQELEPERSVTFSRTINDRLAQIVAADPQRFRAFASLPMSAPDRAADELDRAVQDLGHVGAMIYGQTGGKFLDDPSVRPVLAAAERLSVPIYLHPAPPPERSPTPTSRVWRPTCRSRWRPPAGMACRVRHARPEDGPGWRVRAIPGTAADRRPYGGKPSVLAPTGRRDDRPGVAETVLAT